MAVIVLAGSMAWETRDTGVREGTITVSWRPESGKDCALMSVDNDVGKPVTVEMEVYDTTRADLLTRFNLGVPAGYEGEAVAICDPGGQIDRVRLVGRVGREVEGGYASLGERPVE